MIHIPEEQTQGAILRRIAEEQTVNLLASPTNYADGFFETGAIVESPYFTCLVLAPYNQYSVDGGKDYIFFDCIILDAQGRDDDGDSYKNRIGQYGCFAKAWFNKSNKSIRNYKHIINMKKDYIENWFKRHKYKLPIENIFNQLNN